jgi:hypothetical protein
MGREEGGLEPERAASERWRGEITARMSNARASHPHALEESDEAALLSIAEARKSRRCLACYPAAAEAAFD